MAVAGGMVVLMLMAAMVVQGVALAINLTSNSFKLTTWSWGIVSLVSCQLLNAKYRCRRKPGLVGMDNSTPWVNATNVQSIWNQTAWITA
ncbi:hypothetical protein E5720_03980 [Rhodococcus sp. PAMC28707]|uniref:hypothetical protein n=1 Tax=unclassified Rhodococcus (in: high G+C Gram-positive bacteria) TaxID=192944 RepID=UPI00109DD1A3|nr:MULTISPECIES: hypothetical protein [unclassified Rhodococcus (in: high G+C Gram-positive bacteria)]QCB50537.1 hypothetical protein E5769_10035 [Rhodococcus sp. PAMC28705]QCB57771.1 hypothetical protein E5720_03980 [Rhodococcus sp. PAMC28707]